MGGCSREREVSLRSGGKILESLLRQGFDAISIDPDINLVENLKRERVDLVFIALHGQFGEDGTIQGLLEMMELPYTGSGVLASALSMDKVMAKRIFQAEGIPTPAYEVVSSSSAPEVEAERVIEKFGLPLIIKPIKEGSSIGVEILKKEEETAAAIRNVLAEHGEAFIEEYLSGMTATIGMLGSGDSLRPLPVLELVTKKEFYDYEAKYTKGMTEFIIPARLPKPVYEHTQKIALDAHRALGCHGFSRVDVIVMNNLEPYILEVNTIPGMTDLSDLPAEAAHAGISYDELVLEILAGGSSRPGGPSRPGTIQRREGLGAWFNFG